MGLEKVHSSGTETEAGMEALNDLSGHVLEFRW